MSGVEACSSATNRVSPLGQPPPYTSQYKQDLTVEDISNQNIEEIPYTNSPSEETDNHLKESFWKRAYSKVSSNPHRVAITVLFAIVICTIIGFSIHEHFESEKNQIVAEQVQLNQEKIGNLTRDLEDAQGKLSKIEEDHAVIESSIQTIHTLGERLLNLTQAIQESQEELSARFNRTVNELRSENKKLTSELRNDLKMLNESIVTIKKVKADIQADLNHTKLSVNNLREYTDFLVSTLNESILVISKNHTELGALVDSNHEVLLSQVQEYKQDIDQLESQQGDLENDVQNNIQDLGNVRVDINNLKSGHSSLGQRVGALEDLHSFATGLNSITSMIIMIALVISLILL